MFCERFPSCWLFFQTGWFYRLSDFFYLFTSPMATSFNSGIQVLHIWLSIIWTVLSIWYLPFFVTAQNSRKGWKAVGKTKWVELGLHTLSHMKTSIRKDIKLCIHYRNRICLAVPRFSVLRLSGYPLVIFRSNFQTYSDSLVLQKCEFFSLVPCLSQPGYLFHRKFAETETLKQK